MKNTGIIKIYKEILWTWFINIKYKYTTVLKFKKNWEEKMA